MCRKCGKLGAMDGDNLTKGAAAGGGVAASLLINVAVRKIPMVDEQLNGQNGKIVRGGLIVAKGAAGLYAASNSDDHISAFGMGVVGSSVVEGINLAYQLISKREDSLLGYTEDTELLGEVVELDLDELGNPYSRLEEYHAVAEVDDDFVTEEMELAYAADDYEYEDEEYYD